MTRFTIARHAVPVREAYGGLSDLQHAMLHDASDRIFSAPTGAGKSYAFQRGVVQDGRRVLFIVPTRRLAENLAAAMRRDLAAEGIGEDAIARRIVIWTSDERRRQETEDPTIRVGRLRVRQLRQSDLTADEGRMILATPESVAWGVCCTRHGPTTARAQLNIADFCAASTMSSLTGSTRLIRAASASRRPSPLSPPASVATGRASPF